MSALHEQLAEFEGVWKSADTESKEFENLPDGKYQAVIDECRFEQSKASGRWQLAWVLKVVAPGEYANRKIFNYMGLNNDIGIQIVKRSIYKCGLQVEDPKDLPGQLPYLLDRVIKVTLKTNKKNGSEFQNMYVDDLISETSGEKESAGIQEDDCPF